MNPYNKKISNKRLLMQYLRLIPAKLGLVNKAAFFMQIKRIYPDDIFVVSYVKSGNTWVRFIIAYMKKGIETEITFDDLEYIVPDNHNGASKDIIDSQKANRIIKSHHLFFDYYPRMIYIYRDYRDVLVSYYHFQLGLHLYSGSFSEFIRSKLNPKYAESWKEHIKGAIAYNEKYPGKSIMVSYELLITDFKESAIKIAKFCKFDIEKINFELLEVKTNFQNLKENETKHGSRFMEKTKSHFMRKGKTGGWKDIFTQEDLDFLYSDKELVAVMQLLGYNCAAL